MKSKREDPSVDIKIIEELRSLQTDDEEDVVLEIIQIFIKTTTEMFKNMNQANSQKNLEPLRIMAHTLKSSTASVGAMKLCELVTEIEKLAKAGQKEEISEILIKAEQEFKSVQKELEALTR
jgi:HPt (histidine-containing phosphotransfer) domain-containing protein